MVIKILKTKTLGELKDIVEVTCKDTETGEVWTIRKTKEEINAKYHKLKLN